MKFEKVSVDEVRAGAEMNRFQPFALSIEERRTARAFERATEAGQASGKGKMRPGGLIAEESYYRKNNDAVFDGKSNVGFVF